MSSHPQNKSFDSFEKVYSFYIPDPIRSFYAPQDLDRFLRARFEFCREMDGDIKLSVHNPDPDLFWLINSSIVEMLMPDAPFIVDTILDYCASRDIKVNLVVHPVLRTRRESGVLQSVSFADDSATETTGRLESYVYLEIGRRPDKDLKRIATEVFANLKDLETIVRDFPDMRSALETLQFAEEDEKREVQWLAEHFVLLGAGVYESPKPDARAPFFGLMRKEAMRAIVGAQTPHVRPDGPAIQYVETNVTSDVNRRKRLQLIALRGQSRGLMVIGHFTHRARRTFRDDVPSIKKKLNEIAATMKAAPDSHVRKELFKAAEVLPIAVLVTRGTELIGGLLSRLVSAVYSDEADFSFTRDLEYDLLWIEGLVPARDEGQIPSKGFWAFTSENEIEVLYDIRHVIGRNNAVLLGVRSPKLSPEKLLSALENASEAFFTSWSARFRRLVANRYVGEQLIHERLQRYFHGITPDYELHQLPEETLHDLDRIDRLVPGECSVHYYRRAEGHDVVKVYTDRAANLSDFVPVLTNFGFVIQEETTFPFARKDHADAFTYAFRVPGTNADLPSRKRIAEAVASVLNGHASSEPVNGLALIAGFGPRDLQLVKALSGYLFQIDRSYSRLALQHTLLRYPKFAAALLELLRSKHELSEDAGRRTALADDTLTATFSELQSVVDEAICRAYTAIVRAIVRTNMVLEREEVAFKIRSGEIDNIPRPVPLFEIYVYSYGMEGIHLRGGMTARGGLRWSDRPDDFRTEILGLMKAQMVKNTVIVPVGSKGGFVLKNRVFADRNELRRVGIESYKRYIQCLLDLTDNLSPAGKTVPAHGIRRLDGDDAYLVVAADKGTATFSDIANSVSEEHHFWLGDAFASGGGNGYDHKVQGITARGAWEAVKRHFHEMGLDPEVDPVDAVGIGDMSGDVFGNGLLLSKSIRLLAAFNHLYVFLDPDPDPGVSFIERQRLFKNGLNWNDYDPALISSGGGLFDRGARRIALSKQIRSKLGIDRAALSGEELIRAILRAPVDLLWNGGIGTYVKASAESAYQAGDATNDRVRIDAGELRAKVVGEGGNLGLTQAARVEAAAHGVRLNSDAIDNSAGVDMSDHEVNLKILLNGLVRQNKLKGQAERNRLIRKYEQAEVDLVLRHNYENCLALSVDERRVPHQFTYFRALVRFLNREGLLSREQDSIPFEADLERIEESTKTLARPILCALMGFTKLHLARVFEASDGFREGWYDRFVLRYFPTAAVKAYRPEILRHPLKREIIITEVVNETVNRAGIAFYQRMFMRTGRPLEQIADAYMRVTQFLEEAHLRHTDDQWLHADLHYEYILLLEEQLFSVTRRILEDGSTSPIGGTNGFVHLLEQCIPHSVFRVRRELRPALRALGSEESGRVMTLFRRVDVLQDAFLLQRLNHNRKNSWKPAEYFAVLERYHIRELRRVIQNLNPASPWEIMFLSKLEQAAEELTRALVVAERQEGPENRERLMGLIKQMVGQGGSSPRSPAALYEMLEFALHRLIGPGTKGT